MKLSKTQTEVMGKATAAGRVRVYGRRERDAALRLSEAGYLERIRGGSYLTGIEYALKQAGASKK
jgi:predicted transcriptional regulator of viral defense system